MKATYIKVKAKGRTRKYTTIHGAEKYLSKLSDFAIDCITVVGSGIGNEYTITGINKAGRAISYFKQNIHD